MVTTTSRSFAEVIGKDILQITAEELFACESKTGARLINGAYVGNHSDPRACALGQIIMASKGYSPHDFLVALYPDKRASVAIDNERFVEWTGLDHDEVLAFTLGFDGYVLGEGSFDDGVTPRLRDVHRHGVNLAIETETYREWPESRSSALHLDAGVVMCHEWDDNDRAFVPVPYTYQDVTIVE